MMLLSIITNADDLKLNDKFKLPINEYLKLPSEFTDLSSREMYYNENKKDPLKSVLLSSFLPGGGLIYLGEWELSIPFIIFESIAIYHLLTPTTTTAVYNPLEDPSDKYDDYIGVNNHFERSQVVAALAAFSFVKILELFATYKLTEKYNINLKNKLKPYTSFNINNSKIETGLSYQF